MSQVDVNSVADQLAKTGVAGSTEISFAGRGIKLDGEKEAGEILEAINGCQTLRCLRLEGNTMGVEAAKAIGKALEKHPELQRALFSDMFTGRLKTEIPEALRYLCDGMVAAGARLTELDLSDNAFGPNGMKGLVDFLKSSSCYSLRILRLHNNGLGVTGGKMLAESLLECHRRSVAAGMPLALQVFQSGRGRLENEGSTALAEAFKAMGSLQEVVMPQNGINHPGITALAEAFQENQDLRILDLQDNTFTVVGARSMAKALPHLAKLDTINFGECLVRSEGARVLAKAIQAGNPNLRVLSLTFNEINTASAKAIVKAIAKKPRLERLDLNGNALGEGGIEDVQEAMRAVQHEDHLGTFSDDEGSDDEGDAGKKEEEQEEEEEEEEEEAKEDEEGDMINDPQLSVQGVAITPRSQDKTISVAEFLQSISSTNFQRLGTRKEAAFMEYLGEEVDDVDQVIELLMKVSLVITADSEQVKLEACQCGDAMLMALFNTDNPSAPAQVANGVLVHLGLIKGEDKKFKPLSDLNGALLLLEHCVQQTYFPKLTRDILKEFLARPSSRLEACNQSTHVLRTALFKF